MEQRMVVKSPLHKRATLSGLVVVLALFTSGCVPTDNNISENNPIATEKSTAKPTPVNKPTASSSSTPTASSSETSESKLPDFDQHEEEKTYPIKWDSYDVVDAHNIKFHFLAETAPDPCSGDRVVIAVDETPTTIDPDFKYKMPEDPSNCTPYDWSVDVHLTEPLGDKEIVQ